MASALRGDEMGFFWEEPRAVAQSRGEMVLNPSPRLLKKLAERSGPRWTAPDLGSIKLKGVKQLSIDLECRDEELSALGQGCWRDPKKNYIVGIALGTDDGRRWYIPVRHEGGGNLDEGLVKRWAMKVLNEFDGELVGAKLIYDLVWLAMWGIMFPKVKAFHDIQVAEPLLDEWRLSYGLDELSWEYLGEGKDQSLLNMAAEAYGFGSSERLIKTNLWRLPAEFVGPYGEGDVDRPLRIWAIQRVKLAEEGLMRVYDIERKLIPLLVRMKLRGVRVDMRRVEEVTSILEKKFNEFDIQLKREFGLKASFTSNGSLAPGLREAGIPLQPTPSTKDLPPHMQRMSVNKIVLDKYKNHPKVKLILEGRKLATLIGTFMRGHLQTHAIPDGNQYGIIHCDFNQLKGESGGTIARFSSSNPNLQNIPARDEELAPLVRSCFVPFTRRWDRLDESQIEYRLLVNFARGQGAEEAREMYRNDPTTDFHVMCGNFIGADASDSFIRKRVKNTNFCKVYGGGIPKLASTFGCSIEEATEFSNKYDRELPFVKYTHEQAMMWGGRRGYVETLLGRKQRFSLWEPIGNFDRKAVPMLEKAAREAYGTRITRAYLYAALNRKLQASAADVMKKGMVDGYEAGCFDDDALGAPLLTVHDELDCDNDMTPRAIEAMREAKRHMEIGFKDEVKVPIVCDHSYGDNWAEAS